MNEFKCDLSFDSGGAFEEGELEELIGSPPRASKIREISASGSNFEEVVKSVNIVFDGMPALTLRLSDLTEVEQQNLEGWLKDCFESEKENFVGFQ